MEQTSFELTPKQKGILATLSRETGKPVPTLLDAALEALQEHEHPSHRMAGQKMPASAVTPQKVDKPIWEIAEELFGAIPDEELAKLPVDGAAQHDHYLYGLPKRST